MSHSPHEVGRLLSRGFRGQFTDVELARINRALDGWQRLVRTSEHPKVVNKFNRLLSWATWLLTEISIGHELQRLFIVGYHGGLSYGETAFVGSCLDRWQRLIRVSDSEQEVEDYSKIMEWTVDHLAVIEIKHSPQDQNAQRAAMLEYVASCGIGIRTKDLNSIVVAYAEDTPEPYDGPEPGDDSDDDHYHPWSDDDYWR